MSVLEILTYPDPRLREISQNVELVTSEIQTLVENMLETMYAAKGIGLAAPQVGRLLRILVIDIRRTADAELSGAQRDEPLETKTETTSKTELASEDDSDLTELERQVKFPLVLINPVILQGEGQTTYEEGCLSVPGYYEEVRRFERIQVEALDQEGRSLKIETDGLLAICIQHEMDHLEGKLFIDRLSFVKSSKIKNKIKKLGYPNKAERKKEDL